MRRTVFSPGLKSQGFCGQRDFLEAQLSTWAGSQSDVNRAKQRTAIQSWGAACQLSTHNTPSPKALRVDLLGGSDQPTLTFVSYSTLHFFGGLTSELVLHPGGRGPRPGDTFS